jgi:hypothetical protein
MAAHTPFGIQSKNHDEYLSLGPKDVWILGKRPLLHKACDKACTPVVTVNRLLGFSAECRVLKSMRVGRSGTGRKMKEKKRKEGGNEEGRRSRATGFPLSYTASSLAGVLFA